MPLGRLGPLGRAEQVCGAPVACVVVRSLGAVVGACVCVALLGGCATSEFTVSEARDDLVHVGWTRPQAQCFLDGMHDFYANQYVDLNRREAARRKAPFSGVNPRGTELFVRNELTGAGSLSASELAETRRLVQRCRG